MELFTLTNRSLRVTISTEGAEMQSIYDTVSEREVMWQGDPKYWGGRSPVLFPAVGGLWNGVFHYEGRTYKMPKHGFVRAKTWKGTQYTPARARFEYMSTADDMKSFPFPFRVTIDYSLWNRKVRAKFYVDNYSDKPMFFQMGGHPALNLPDFNENEVENGYVKFIGKPTHILRAREQGCLQPEHFDVPLNGEGLLPVSVATFANEAIILEKSEVKGLILLDTHRRPVATVYSTAPCWLIWSMQGVHCPYVCFEPWYGLPDYEGFDGPLNMRPYVQRLGSRRMWEGGYTIEIP